MTAADRRAEQLIIDLPVRTSLARGDFFVTEANAIAVAQIDAWRHWPGSKFALAGPEGSGKTHLAHVWRDLSGARIVSATDLAGADILGLAATSVCVEDVSAIAGDRASEDALFHLHNLILSEGHSLLLTARTPPAQLGLSLPDLKSRLMGTQFVEMSAPDDVLLGAVLLKLFHDRQIAPLPNVIPWLVPRMPRSFAMAQRVVAEIDRTALVERARVSRHLARVCLDRIEKESADAPD